MIYRLNLMRFKSFLVIWASQNLMVKMQVKIMPKYILVSGFRWESTRNYVWIQNTETLWWRDSEHISKTLTKSENGGFPCKIKIFLKPSAITHCPYVNPHLCKNVRRNKERFFRIIKKERKTEDPINSTQSPKSK